MSQNQRLLSPSRSYEFKTPPRSNSSFASQKDGSSDGLRSRGMPSPEMSSPRFNDVNGKPTLDELLLDVRNMATARQPEPLSYPLGTRKRAAASQDSKANKKSRKPVVPADFVLPAPSEMPAIVYPSDDKPPYSYATLIGMALLRSPTRQLTLSQIYAWISAHFHYYRKGEVGWQNSIRHNLSLNKSFHKAEKSTDGKGHYWRIVTGHEYQFCNVEESRRSSAGRKSRKRKQQAPQAVPKLPPPTTPRSMPTSFLPPVSSLQLPDPTAPATSSMSLSPNTAQVVATLRSQTPIRLTSIPELPQPSPSFKVSGADHLFRAFFNSPDAAAAAAHDSPRALPLTSSFNCRSNFEPSPIKPGQSGPGPLLEPLTPHAQAVTETPTQQQQPPRALAQLQSALQPPAHNAQEDLLVGFKFKTPSNPIQTPLINLGSSSVIRKLWASPSYLDDFYASPLRDSEAENVGLCGSPLALKGTRHLGVHPKVPLQPSKMAKFQGSSTSNRLPQQTTSNGYTTNEIFGIDICTLPQDEDRLH